jgi:hypothetical protein
MQANLGFVHRLSIKSSALQDMGLNRVLSGKQSPFESDKCPLAVREDLPCHLRLRVRSTIVS